MGEAPTDSDRLPRALDRLVGCCSIATILASVMALLAFVFLPVLMQSFELPRRLRCAGLMKQHAKALQLYLNNFEQFLPLAWHVGGATLAEDLSNLSFYRWRMYDQARGDFPRPVPASWDLVATPRQRFAEVQELWTDPTKDGWTRDYVSPEIAFRMPDSRALVYDKHTAYTQLTMDVSPTVRPLLADVNASLPNPDARDPNDPEHEAEMRKGFSVVKAAGMDVFVGAGPSLRRAGDYSTSRFDFRHRGGVNVLFLDGHVEWVSADQKAWLEKIHRYWNSVNPAGDSGKGTGGEPSAAPE